MPRCPCVRYVRLDVAGQVGTLPQVGWAGASGTHGAAVEAPPTGHAETRVGRKQRGAS